MNADEIKQERSKLHQAADNIQQMLNVLIKRDTDRFFWAWQQLEANTSAVRACFIETSKEHCKKVDELFADHTELIEKQDELREKLMKKPELSTLTDEELNDLIAKFQDFIKDMSERFGLGEFEE